MSKEKITEEELREHYVQMQMLDGQVKQISQQLQQIEMHKMEIISTKEALENIKNSEKNAEMLAPISQGIFVKAKIADTENFIVNVGGNVAVPKTIEETKVLLDKQIREMERAENELGEHLQNLDQEMTKKALYLQKMME